MSRIILFLLTFFSVQVSFASRPLQKALEKKAGGSTEMEVSKDHQEMAQKAQSFEGALPEHTFPSGQSLSDFYKDGPLVLTFYRGHWCPYCMLELKEYQRLYSQFSKLGAKIIAVAPDLAMEVKKTKDKNNLSFTLISDQNHALAKKLGLAFKVDEKTLEQYKKYGIDLAGSQGNEGDTLPMPGTYVIDSNGEVVYAFVDPNYKKRAEPEEVLEVVQGIQAED